MQNSSTFKDPRFNRYDEKRNYRRLIIWTEDNAEHLPPDYIPALERKYGHNKNLLKAHLYGEFCPLYEGNAYPCYIPSRHNVPDIEPTPYKEIVAMFDFNANPVAWSAIQTSQIHLDGWRRTGFVILHEAANQNHQLDDAVAEFAFKFPVRLFYQTPIRLYGDRSGHAGSHKVAGSDFETIRNLLISLGYKDVTICATRSVAPETASVDAVNRLFLEDLLFVCVRCKFVQRSFMATTWKEGKRQLDKPAGETWTHHSDGIKYWAWQETRDIQTIEHRRTHGINR